MTDSRKNIKSTSGVSAKCAGTDRLTGLPGGKTIESKIIEAMKKCSGGFIIMIDVDNLNRINMEQGHQRGDMVLIKLAELIRMNFFSTDIIGRYGGDEFIVFIPAGTSTQFILNKGRAILNQLKEFGKKEKISNKLTVTMAVVPVQEGDTADELVQQAEFTMRRCKRRGGGIVSMTVIEEQIEENDGDREEAATETGAIDRDVELIWNDLREQAGAAGAYCQDYENFSCIYRFVERGLWRTEESAYAILLTLTDRDGRFLSVEEQNRVMERLSRIIMSSLRIGDIYTQYSSCQFLIMVLDVSYENALSIVERIRINMRRSSLEESITMIDCAIHPLKPAEKLHDGGKQNGKSPKDI